MSSDAPSQSLHFEIPATFVGGHTTCLVVAFDVVEGELRLEGAEQAVLALPKAAPFEVHVRGRLNRRSGGTWGLADPDGALSRALGLEPVRASADELRDWRRRLAIARILFVVAALAHTLLSLWMLPPVWTQQIAVARPDTPLFLIGSWLFFAVSFPLFFAAAVFWYPRSVGYVRRLGLFLPFSMVFFLFGALLSGVLSGFALLIAPAVALLGWHLLRPIPMLGEIPAAP